MSGRITKQARINVNNDDAQTNSAGDIAADTGGDFRSDDRPRAPGRFGGNRGGFGDRQMFPAVCTKCNKETTVPFQPTAGKPVYCRECFMEVRQDRPRRSFGGGGGGGGGFRREF